MNFRKKDLIFLVDNKNEGYLLKNFGDKGWGLFNMQSYAVVMSGTFTEKGNCFKKCRE